MSIKEDNFNSYIEYNKTLRAWIVGLGFAVPALFIVNDAAQKKLLASESAECIIWLFLIGAAAQVFMAFVNKVVSWCAYYSHDGGEYKDKWFISYFAKLENMFLIDIVFDLVSLFTFSWSIILIVGLFTNA